MTNDYASCNLMPNAYATPYFVFSHWFKGIGPSNPLSLIRLWFFPRPTQFSPLLSIQGIMENFDVLHKSRCLLEIHFYRFPLTCHVSRINKRIKRGEQVGQYPNNQCHMHTAGDVASCQFCHRLNIELSLLSILSVTEVTELSILHMFLGLKLV